MVRVARTKGPEKLSFMRNPAPGSVLAAPAGGRAEAEFDFINDSPEVAAFELAVEGLSPDWLAGVGPQAGAMAAASGGGSLRLTLAPPLTASVGQYDFSVRILCGGDAIAPAATLVLQVEPASEDSLLAIAPSTPMTLPTEPATGAPVVFAPEPVPMTDPPAGESSRVERTPTPRRRPPPVQTPLVEPSPVEPSPIEQSPAEPSPNGRLPVGQTAPDPSPIFTLPPPVRSEAPPATPTPVPRPRPAALPPEEEPVLVEHQAAPSRALLMEEETPPEVEAALVDLADGGAVALRPGETRLLRFTFTNETSRETTYVLDEDQSLPGEWITLVQDQVNLMRSGKGDVSLRLSPPLNAEPGDYPFSVTLGPQGGMLTPRALTLTVQATPAVKLTSKEGTVRIGPIASFADFHLSVESAGNADTAFRVAVLPPLASSDGEARDSKPVYDTPQWQYLFDKEMEALRALASRQAPRPVPIRLRLQRKGPWWFGFRETHHVRVAAVPVTDAANGGKPVNTVEVTATRLRFWPMPYLTLIPLFLLLLVLSSGGADDLDVTDAQYQESDTHWVVNPPDKPSKETTLRWHSSTPLLRITGEKVNGSGAAGQGSGPSLSRIVPGTSSLPQSVPVSRQEPDVEYHYKVSRLIGGGDRDAFVHYIYTRSDTPLKATYQDAGHRSYALISGPEITITVPKRGYAHLNLFNTAVTQHNDTLDLNYWIVHQPDSKTSAFSLTSIVPQGTIGQRTSKTPLISLTGKNDLDDNKIVIVTSDAHLPILTVILKKEGMDAQ